MSNRRRTHRFRGRRTQGQWLTLLYVSALSSVALLTCGGQWLVQRQLVNGESDSRVINIAGRQRMLSQRLAKCALRLSRPTDVRQDDLAELRETLAEWSRGHGGLQRGDAEAGLPGGNSPEVQRLFETTEPYFRAMRSSALTLLDPAGSPEMKRRAAELIQQKEGAFLEGMDAIVSRYVVEAERKVARLRSLELGVLALTLAVLTVEGLLIFRPAVDQIDRTLNRLNRTSRRLRAAKARAEEADAAKSRFLANVSHELRTPMTAVLGMTELARSEHDPDRRNRHLDTVSEAGELLLGLLNDLIDFARIDSGKLELVIRPFSPHLVLSRVVRMMRPACEAKNLKLAPLVAVDEDLCVLGDARRLEQVLLNLLSNAIKWTSDGVVYVRCEVLQSRDSLLTIRYTVQDTGVGISDADHSRVFEPFTQVAGDKTTARGGVGLGLAICKRIADAMGAELDLTSAPGVGTTVKLTSDFCLAPAPARPKRKIPLTGGLAGLRVLVVEDTEVIQALFHGCLTGLGCEFTIVTSGEEAVAESRRMEFDVALIDLQLPGADGVATAQQLRRQCDAAGRSMRLVCVTADARASLVDLHLKEIFDAVLTKPFDREQIITELAHVFDTPAAEEHQPGAPTGDAEIDIEQELSEVYLTVAEQQEAALAAALADQRWPDARVLAHRLAGQLAYLGAPDLVEQLRGLEDACLAERAHEAARLGELCLPRLAELRRGLESKATQRVG